MSLRQQYEEQGLDEAAASPNPFTQFNTWFADAVAAREPQVNAMTLATATPDGQLSARMVLLKGFDERGFVFYTNQESRKAQELRANPRAALVFWWYNTHRQVRVEGIIEVVSSEEADEYFKQRPLGSQLGAWASPQSQVVSGRSVIDDQLQEYAQKFQGQPVPRPPHWGGYRVIPHTLEFWQGRGSRLHDRLRYCRQNDQWLLERLAP